MPVLSIRLEGDKAWPDLKDRKVINAMGEDASVEITALANGMKSGNTSVAFRVDAPTGEVVIFETSLLLLKTAVEAFIARYGEPIPVPTPPELSQFHKGSQS
jgi:hypothetical protein